MLFRSSARPDRNRPAARSEFRAARPSRSATRGTCGIRPASSPYPLAPTPGLRSTSRPGRQISPSTCSGTPTRMETGSQRAPAERFPLPGSPEPAEERHKCRRAGLTARSLVRAHRPNSNVGPPRNPRATPCKPCANPCATNVGLPATNVADAATNVGIPGRFRACFCNVGRYRLNVGFRVPPEI